MFGPRLEFEERMLQEVQQVPVAAPAAVQASLPTLPPAPMLEPSFNFLQDSQVTSLYTIIASNDIAAMSTTGFSHVVF